MAVGIGGLTQVFFARGIASKFTQKELDDILVNIRNVTPQQARQQLSSSIAQGKLSQEMAEQLLARLSKLNSLANWQAGLSSAAGMQVYEFPSSLIERNKMLKELEKAHQEDTRHMSSAERYTHDEQQKELAIQLDKMWHDYIWGSFVGDVVFARVTQNFGAMLPKSKLNPGAFRTSALNRALQRASSVNVVEVSQGLGKPTNRRVRMFMTRDAYESYSRDIDGLVQQVPPEQRAQLASKFYVHTTTQNTGGNPSTVAQPIKAGGKEYFVVEIPDLTAVERVFIRNVAMPINADIQLKPGESTASLRSDYFGMKDRGWTDTLGTKDQAAYELGIAYEEGVFGGKNGNLTDLLTKAIQRETRGNATGPQGVNPQPNPVTP
ncbi:MAG: hypothetical protein R3A80_10840 [Bdellovibrionota bacterium]